MKKEIKVITDNAALNIALDTINIKKQALIFVNTKKSAEKLAEDIARKLKEKTNKEISEQILNALSKPTTQCERLSKCVEKGIAFHHAGLTHKQKEIVEDNFRKGEIKIICCTPTLAYGLDLPAFRAIIRDLRRYGLHGLTWIPVLEYLQQAGRAGRPKFDEYGEAIAVASTEPEKEKIEKKYIKGKPEKIFSKLAVEPVLRMYLLSLIATRFVKNKKQILNFFEKTFWAYQFKDMEKLELIIEKILDLLEEFEFISSTKEEFSSANELNNQEYKPTIIGKRVAELYIDPLTAHFIITCLRKATVKKIKAFSFLQMISHTLEIRPLLRVRVKEYDKIQEKLLYYNEFILDEEPSMFDPDYEDFINSIKTSLFFQEWIDEKDEEFLLEGYGIRPGEIRSKLEIADWLLYATEELAKLLKFQPLVKEIIKLRFRLKYGAKEELLPLLQLRDIGRVRARRLYNNKIRDISDVKKADIALLKQILGQKIAESVKQQVGQEIKPVKLNKRKGQISLEDYKDG